ncbi:MAG: GNAT family N-acetyltransferase [Saprospiraceae bacterium]|nr:GNAT family N-acetyltransferase [Saprospiraceae bacterium]NNL90666.1 GNAT family N-acetyltransferase [Saprospiraceae bacterium]
MIQIRLANNTQDLNGIINLQSLNLQKNISENELKAEGFVTVVHDFEVLSKMNAQTPAIIAEENGIVVGYCLSMTRNFERTIQVLVPMFEKMNTLSYKGKLLGDLNYLVCGQVCIAKHYRSQGLFKKMYEYSRMHYSQEYAYMLTEISHRNPRSIRAHEKIGFDIIHEYADPSGEIWKIVFWDWQND